MKGYPKGFLTVLLAVLALLLVSGLLLAPTTLTLHAQWSMTWRLSTTARSVVAWTHASGALVTLVLLGALWTVHMRMGWRRAKSRVSGSAMVIMMALLAASALGVYYLGDGEWYGVNALLHLVLGVVVAVQLPVHWILADQRRRAQRVRHHTLKSAELAVKVATKGQQ